MNKAEEFTKYPICDTDIWVNICLGQICDILFSKYKKVIVADVVQGEILRWDKPNYKYSYIAERYNYYKQLGKIIVINHSVDILAEDRILLERQLEDLGFENDFNNRPPEDNKGEFVSAIYADYFKIPFMKSNDSEFYDGGRGKVSFPHLEVKNWYATTEELIHDNIEKIKIRKFVERQNIEMNNIKSSTNKLKKEERMNDLLKKLQEKYSKKI